MAVHRRSRALPNIALLLLSLLWAAGVLQADLLPDLIPNPLMPLLRQALSLGLLAIVACALAIAHGDQWPRGRMLWSCITVGVGLFVAPAMLVSWANPWVPGLTQAALFTLTPIFTLVFEPYIGGENAPQEPSQSRMGLLAALAAFGGALCAFHVNVPTSIQEAGGLFTVIAATACLAAANCKAVAVAHELDKGSIRPLAAIAAATAAILLGTASAVGNQAIWEWAAVEPALLWAVGVEVPGLLLLFWLTRQMSATRMATRYIWAPLIAVFVGAALMQAHFMPRTWIGLLLMALGAAYLLLSPASAQEQDMLSLR